MLRENIVFGPIHSRRLGASLGINLLPQKGKLCNFDCIYCECGWNKDGLGDRNIPSADDVKAALGAMLQECSKSGARIDSITFSGDGEPTLNPDFPQIIDITLALRDKYYPGAKVSVLSNSTRISRKEVFEALRKVDNPIMKIDAPTDPELTGFAPKMGSVVATTAEYAVYSLSGKRLGTVKIRHATETETLLKAKFGKGVYMLRSENGKKILFHVK